MDWWLKRADVFGRSDEWSAVNRAVVDFTDSNWAHIRDADTAQRSGQSVFMAEYMVITDPANVVRFLGVHEMLEHWSRSVSGILDLGWLLNDWSVHPDGEFYRAFATFTR